MSSPPPPDHAVNRGSNDAWPPAPRAQYPQPPYPQAPSPQKQYPQASAPRAQYPQAYPEVAPYRQPDQRSAGAPGKPSFGSTVTTAILALLLGVLFGGFCLVAFFVLLDDAPDEAVLFVAGAVGGVFLVVGAVLLLWQKWAGFWVTLVGAVLVIAGTFPPALATFATFRTNSDHKSNLFFFVAAIVALIVIVMVLLPSTRRLLRHRAGGQGVQPASGVGPAVAPVRPVTAAGQALGIAASVAGLLLGVVAVSVLPDAWEVAPGGLGDKLPLLVQTLGVLLAVVGAVVAFGRKWGGAILLVIGGGTALLFLLVAVFRASSLDIGFTGSVYLVSSAACVVLPLLPATRRYFGR